MLPSTVGMQIDSSEVSWLLSVLTGEEGAGPTNEIVKVISDIIYILLQREQWM